MCQYSILRMTASSSDKLKLPEIRFLTPEEDQQLTDLGETSLKKCSGRTGKSARNNDA
jgi:hypothetical protein